jgi:hypothetical protein
MEKKKKKLTQQNKNIRYDFGSENERNVTIPIRTTEYMRNNGSLFAHVFYHVDGVSPDPGHASYKERGVLYAVHSMTRFLPRPKKVVKANLLSGAQAPVDPLGNVTDDRLNETISFFVPTLHLGLVVDHSVYKPGSLPPQMAEAMQFVAGTGEYFPPLFFNEFFLMREHLVPMNETVSVVNLTLSTYPLSLLKWQLMSQMMVSWKMQTETLGSSQSEVDEFKRMILETNPWLLALTAVVSILHTVFDMLAFKNDITFWKGKKSMQGLSVRSIFISVGMQVIIFLYLLDNDTSWMVLFSAGLALAIDCWKITKACIVHVDLSVFPFIHVRDRESYESETKTHDREAIRLMSYAVYPLLVIYTVYSLIYHEHKSWYSFIIGTLVQGVYLFGFTTQFPAVYINYKLKSVAHMPWRPLTYKFFNTIIDDLFAFIIKMPTWHRVAAFRDDVFFIIFLYQKWTYRVDHSRVNEFGQGGGPPEDSQEPEPNRTPVVIEEEEDEEVEQESKKDK